MTKITDINSRYINNEEYAYIPGYPGYYISKSGKLLGPSGKILKETIYECMKYKGYKIRK